MTGTMMYVILASAPLSFSDAIQSPLVLLCCLSLFLAFGLLCFLFLLFQRRHRRRLERAAYVDPLTGGKNKNCFVMEARHILLPAKVPYAMVYLNVSKFRVINEQGGKSAGDLVICAIQSVLKQFAAEQETAGRLNDDHFALLLLFQGRRELEERLRRLQGRINQALSEQALPLHVNLTYGVYLSEQGDADIERMLDRSNIARLAPFRDRAQGAVCNFYSIEIRNNLLREKRLEDKMQEALQNHSFLLYLQPKYDLAAGKIAGAEALARWQDAEEGLISPSDFIPIFEKNGFIIALDLYIFEETCRTIRSWLDRGLCPVPISVNLSRRHLNTENFLNSYHTFMQKYQIPPHCIEFEFTETLVFDNLQVLTHSIQIIHEMGCTCSMDDFGSGYSSLNMLKDVEIDVLKLDRAFFDETSDMQGRSGKVVLGVLDLARRLCLKTVAEGIEYEEQVEFLRTARCDMIQGFIFGRPMPIAEFEQVLPLADGEEDEKRFPTPRAEMK